MSDPDESARHRVDSIKALDALADNGPRTTSDMDRVVIHIDLSADAKLRSAEPDPNDIIHIEATPRKTPAITDETDDWKR